MKEERPMKDDYLWDGSGEPDPEVERLERVLTQFRSHRLAPQFPEPTPAEKSRPQWWHRIDLVRLYAWPRLAAVAATAVMVLAAWLVVRRTSLQGPQGSQGEVSSGGTGWEVASLKGAPKIERSRIGEAGRLKVGQTLETDDTSRASISVGEIGQVEVEPNTRLRLLEARDARNLLALDRGTIRAAIWAPPGQFVVDTPSAVAVDLGCAYTLHVDDSGAGLLRTTLGWVGFKLKGRESFIPAGAVCLTRPGIGPGTPYFDDASENFRDALSKLDFEQAGSEAQPETRDAELGVVLREARPRDALTLWHLLSRLDTSNRARVYSRLAALVPPPQSVTRAGVLAGDRQMLDLWWNQLGFGDTSLWRTFERSWPEGNK